ncbi:hypothetical protein KI387_032126, partial [Taxus chinensis]
NFSGLQVLKLRHLHHTDDAIEMGHLKNLKHLELTGFQNNKISSWQKLKLLQKLKLFYIEGLKELPRSIGNLQSLKELYCDRIEQLPASLVKLRSLQELHLVACRGLKQLPAGFGELSSLTKLNLRHCDLQELPCDFHKLSALQSLDLYDCYSLLRLPEGLGNLQSLTNINVERCSKLITLPDRVAGLSLMKGRISFHECSSLKEIPEDICKLTMLTRLSFSGCKSLRVLPISFSQLTCLEELDLTCESLQELCNDFHSLVRLRRLDMSGCKSLSRLPPSFGNLGCLEVLNLSECDKLEELSSDFGRLGALKDLNLSGCKSLTELSDSFGRLRCLEQLHLWLCSKLEELSSDFNCLRSLVKLNLSTCESLDGKWMDTVGGIQSLWWVDIAGSERMIQRWREMEREKEEWHFEVNSDSYYDEPTKEEQRALLLKRMIPKIFDEERLLIDIHQRPFHSSSLLSHTPLVLIIHNSWSGEINGELFEKNAQQLEWSTQAWRIIYVGGHFSALPDEVKDRILVYTSPNKFSLFLDKFSTAFGDQYITAAFRSRDGLEEKGIRCPSFWEDISYIFDELSFLIRTPRESNLEILRAVLQTDFLLLNNRQK